MDEIRMETFNGFESSNIQKVQYNKPTQQLFIEYVHGNVYQYNEVPSQIWNDIRIAESVGKYVNANIKGIYDFKKVIPQEENIIGE